MPPLVPVLTAIAGTAVGGFFLTATATAAGTTFALTAFGQLAAGVALSALSRALTPKPETGGSAGQKVSMTFGEDQAQSFILGTYATAGDLVFHGSWGETDKTPNLYYVQVIELADLPARFKGLWINGEWAALRNDPEPEFGMGKPVEGYQFKNKDYLWLKFYDGTQTAADPYLLTAFGDDESKPWTSEMIGLGIPYAIVTARFKPEIVPERPECMIELEAWGHYDRRKDSTAGGVGTQRENDWRTWTPSSNPIVLVDNVLRGIRDPITNEVIFGGPAIQSRRLSSSMEFAAMNVCDQPVEVGTLGNTEPRYRAGLEVRVSEEPASIIEELLKACHGEIAVACGQWLLRAGAPGLPVYHFTDADIETMNSTDRFEPFPALDASYNEVTAVYPDPAQGYATKDSPPRKNATFLLEDRGTRNVAELKYPAVPYARQVQRLMFAALKDARRFRRHTVVLTPEASRLAPLDEVSWTSERYGYINKLFAIDLVEHMANGCVAVSLRERDPTDYDWNGTDELDDPVVGPRPPGRPPQVADFTVIGAIIYDDHDPPRPRRPAIQLLTPNMSNVTGIRYRVFNAAGGQVNANAVINPGDEGVVSSDTMALDNEPAALDGVLATYGIITDLDGDAMIVGNGILPDCDYEVQILLEPVTTNRVWSELKPVHTPPIFLELPDFGEIVAGVIGDARDDALAAKAEVLDMQGRVADVEATVAGISEPLLAELHDITDALAGLETGTLTELKGIATAAAIDGWVKDPRFLLWTSTDLDAWAMTGTAYLLKTTLGIYPSSLLFNVPSGAGPGLVTVAAYSTDADQMPDADFTAPYVVVGLRMKYLSGNMAGLYCRPEWRQVGTGTWTRGRAFGEGATLGGIVARWGWVADASYTQDHSFIFERPAITTDAVRILIGKTSTDTNAVSVRVEVFNIRAATQAEVDAYNAHGDASAQISEYNILLTGPGGALAAQASTLRAEYGPAVSDVTSNKFALSTAVQAFAGRLDITEATFGDDNLVKNPTFEDGPRAAGVVPNWWSNWDAQFTILARDPGSAQAWVATAPTRYFARFTGPATVAHEVIAHSYVPIKPGQLVGFRVWTNGASSGSGLNIDFRMRCRFVGPDRSTLISAPIRQRIITTGSWVDSDNIPGFSDPIVAPAGAAYFDTRVNIALGSVGNAYFTDVEARIVDDVAYARAEQAVFAAADATSAVASITNTITAQFGTVSAFVSETATAVAMADFAAASYVFKVEAGGGEASIRLVAFDEPNTGAGSAIMLNADYIIAPGTMSVGRLVVMDHGTNLVPDDQIQSANDWVGTPAMSVIPDSPNPNHDSKGEVRYTSPGAIPASMASQFFPVRSNSRLVCSFQTQRLGGTRLVASARLEWFNHDRVRIEPTFSVIANVDTTAVSIQTWERRIVVPPTAKLARFVFVASPGTDSSGRYYSPKVIVNEDASVLITPDGAFFEMLTAETAWIETANIATLNVGTIWIADGAISRQAWSAQATRPSTVRGDWEAIAAVSINRRAGTPLFMQAGFGWDGAPGSGAGQLQMRLRRGATVINTFGLERPQRAGGQGTHTWFDTTNVSDIVIYRIDVFVPAGYGTGFHFEDVTLFLQELAR